jgi:tetratricopeptide (TPR) repeat protein
MNWMRARSGAGIASVLAAVGGVALAASTRSLNEDGNQAYRAARFEDALRAYTEAQVRSPESPEVQYNIGNVFYRQEDYERASEAYRKALEGAGSLLRRDAAYNLGNARFQAQDYAGAAAAYRGALTLDPSDRDAKRNLEIALQRLQNPPPPPPSKGGPKDQDPQKPQPRPDAQPNPPRDPQEKRSQQPQPSPEDLDRQEAEQLLKALEQEERDNMDREHRKGSPAQPPPGGKDW